MKQKIKVLTGVVIVISVIGLAFAGRYSINRQEEKIFSEQTAEQNINSINSNVDLSISRMFTLHPSEAIEAQELDIRLVVLNYYFVPCEPDTGCAFRQFHAEIAISLISDSTQSQRVSFQSFPNEITALGKIIQLVDGQQDNFKLFVRNLPGYTSGQINTSTITNQETTSSDNK